ncbi:MAG: Hsp33 family molecular chaperone HslO [Alphaproteobacteria bacterium]
MNETPSPAAHIVPFYLASGAENVALIRGRVASIGSVATDILGRHKYPLAVASLQAEALALAACLASTLKFDGVFTLQAKGDGYIKTLFADMTSDGHLRGYSAFDADAGAPVADDLVMSTPADVPALLGSGYIAFTVDEEKTGGRYQGIVDLEGATLSDAATRWFANSEQLDTAVMAAEHCSDGVWQARAIMLQRIAAEGGDASSQADREQSDDAWHTARTLMESLRRDELVDPLLGPDALIFRLFNSMEPHVAPSRDVIDQCRCSPQRVQTMLTQLDRAEIVDLADDEDKIEIICEFCKTTRRFHIDNIEA